MSIPPNDAFSLNAHNHTHSHRPKALSRSPPPSYSFLPHTSHSSSPQPSFSGSLKKGEAHKTHGMSLRQRKPSASKAVNGSATANGVMNGSAHHEPLHDEQTREANGNGHAVVEKLKTVKPPIDWEIPRKVFHSSIGASRFFCASSHVGLRRMLTNTPILVSANRAPRHPSLHAPLRRHGRCESPIGRMRLHHRS